MPVIANFDEGPAGAVIATSATIQEVSGAQYTDTSMHGNFAVEYIGNNEFIRINLTNGIEHSGSIYFRSSTLASSRYRFVMLQGAANANICGIGIHSDGKIDLIDTSRQVASTVSWVPDTWHRLDWQFVEASKTLTVRIFLEPQATVHDDEISHSFSGATETPAKWNISGLSSGAGGTLQADTFRVETGLTWLGPYIQAVWYEWDGVAEQPLNLSGIWDGSAEQPVNLNQIVD